MLATHTENIHTHVSLRENNEISAIRLAAIFLSDFADLDDQACLSSLLASEVLKTRLINQRTAFIYATDANTQQPQFMVMTFDQPVYWGEADTAIDFLIAAVVPNTITEESLNALTIALSRQFDDQTGDLDQIKNDSLALNRLLDTLKVSAS